MKKILLTAIIIGFITIQFCSATNPEKGSEEPKKYDFKLSIKDESINNIFSSYEYPKFLYRIPGMINIDPLVTKSNEFHKESDLIITPELLSDAISTKELAKKILDDLKSNPDKNELLDEVYELEKLTQTDIETYLKTGMLELRSMEIFRFEIFLNSKPALTFNNNSIELKDIELKLIYNIRIHYRIGWIKSHVDFNTSGQMIQSTIKLNTYKQGKKLFIKPGIDRLKLVFRVVGFKVTLNMLDYFKPDLQEMELVDIDKLIIAIPSINTNVLVKEFDLLIDNHNLGLGISFGFQ